MFKKPLVNFVIQGPLNDISLSNLDHYLQYGNVIISYWSDDDISRVPKKEGITTVTSDWNKHLDHFNINNIGKQCVSTLAGLELCNSKFVIKLRSDEKYEGFDHVLFRMTQEPSKIFCSNIWFRKDDEYKYHASDHIICGKTKVLTKSFRLLNKWLLVPQSSPFDIFYHDQFKVIRYTDPNGFRYYKAAVETMITIAILTVLKEKCLIDKSIDIMKKYFEVINIDDFKSYIWSSNNYRKLGQQTNLEKLDASISCIEDIGVSNAQKTKQYGNVKSARKTWHINNTPNKSGIYNSIIQKYDMVHSIEMANIQQASLKMIGHEHPYSITEGEFCFIRKTITEQNLKFGTEIGTAFGISALAAGLGFKETKGKLVTIDCYVEEQYNNCGLYAGKEKIYENADGYKITQKLIDLYGLQNHVKPEIGISPIDTLRLIGKHVDLSQEKIDYVFIDAMHTEDSMIADIGVLVPYIREGAVIFFHDYDHVHHLKTNRFLKQSLDLELQPCQTGKKNSFNLCFGIAKRPLKYGNHSLHTNTHRLSKTFQRKTT